MDFGVDIEKKQAVEDLQIRLRGLESRISVLKEELESLESQLQNVRNEINEINGQGYIDLTDEKQQILRDIRANSDERYEEVALQKLYEQRRRK